MSSSRLPFICRDLRSQHERQATRTTPTEQAATRRHRDILYLSGEGPAPADVMFVTTSVEEEDAAESVSTTHGLVLRQRPRMGRSPGSQLFLDVASRAGLKPDACFFTALCRWLVPRAKRLRPDRTMLRWGMPALMEEIGRVKPKIIVCAGKPVFDMLADTSIKFADAHGCWFWSTKAQAHLYVMHPPFMLVMHPEWYEQFRLDLVEVARKLDFINGTGDIPDLPVNITVVRTERELRALVDRWKAERPGVISVDCEWHGKTHVDGQLRTAQFAWTKSDVAVVVFRDEQNQFCFGMEPDWMNGVSGLAEHPLALKHDPRAVERAKYRKCGSIIGSYTDDPEVKFVGHHYAADAPWLQETLGLQVFGKCVLDTEFAQQCVDESSELKLERGIAMRYTTLGRYDIDLVMWKRENKKMCEDG